jgi:hypothetical protein
MGLIPETLRPVFRDRDDFTAGHSLSEQTLAALDDSAAFIVLGSPDVAPADNSHHSGRKAWRPDGRGSVTETMPPQDPGPIRNRCE